MFMQAEIPKLHCSETLGPFSLVPSESPPYLRGKPVTHRGGSHVLAAVRDLRLVGVVGTADHWAGGREAVAPHHAATGLT